MTLATRRATSEYYSPAEPAQYARRRLLPKSGDRLTPHTAAVATPRHLLYTGCPSTREHARELRRATRSPSPLIPPCIPLPAARAGFAPRLPAQHGVGLPARHLRPRRPCSPLPCATRVRRSLGRGTKTSHGLVECSMGQCVAVSGHVSGLLPCCWSVGLSLWARARNLYNHLPPAVAYNLHDGRRLRAWTFEWMDVKIRLQHNPYHAAMGPPTDQRRLCGPGSISMPWWRQRVSSAPIWT